MLILEQDNLNHEKKEYFSLKWIYRFGGIAAILQFIFTLIIIIVSLTLGLKPTTAQEYFSLYETDRFIGILRDDFTSIIIISLYLVTFSCLYIALKRINTIYVTFLTILVFIGVLCCFATHSGFSMIHLSDQYAVATTEFERSYLLAAGQAVIASDMWNSTAGFIAGIFLQGVGLLISLVMLRHQAFSKITIYAGILANGLDLVQHLITPIMMPVGNVLLMIAGPLYLIWFPMLGWDLLKMSKVKFQGFVDIN